jgi:hypothetical protein
MNKDETILEIMKDYPTQKIGLDDFYGRQTVINMMNKAINYTHSSTELPSMEAANTEIVDSLGILKTMKNSPCKEANYDEAYVTGFANCYNWIRDKAIT